MRTFDYATDWVGHRGCGRIDCPWRCRCHYQMPVGSVIGCGCPERWAARVVDFGAHAAAVRATLGALR